MVSEIVRKKSVPEVAELLGVGEDKVRGWIASGELRALNVGTKRGKRPQYRIDPADLRAFEDSRATGKPTAVPVRTVRSKNPTPFKQYF